MKYIIILLLFFLPLVLISQNSLNMNLLGSYDYNNTEGNDIWGWFDTSGNEYALVGLKNGFSCVDVTNPSSPVEKFFISDLSSTWRDIKTWGNYAYITTEANAGLLIVDLTDMTGNTYSHVNQFQDINGSSGISFTSAHNIYIDENGIAYIFGLKNNGSYVANRGVVFLDVAANPTAPHYLGQWDDQYIHDGMVRGDTMYAGCVYQGELYIVDVSDKTDPQTIGQRSTPDSFTHNAWVSDDGNYVFTTDEKSDAYLAAYDISDCSNIQEVDRIQSNPGSNSIPHNAHVDGNFLITSYYRDGTVIHDITYPSNMIEVAYYDSYSGSGNGFDGCWGTYPFLPSGNIISSEINSASGGKGKLLIYERDFQQACYLKGHIYDGQTGLPIIGANMQILTTNNIENSNLVGFYQSAVLNSGSYQLVYSASNYISDTLIASLSNGVMLVQDAFLYQPCNNLNIQTNQNISICENSTYVIGNSVYTNSGNYSDTLQTSYGCDSIVNTNLTINPSSYSTSTVVATNFYNWNGVTYTSSGLYSMNYLNSYGCDSILNLDLTICTTQNINTDEYLCSGVSYIWPVNNNIYTSPGTYHDTILDVNGCEVVYTLNLNYEGGTIIDTVYSCNSYQISGTSSPTWTQSGVYNYTVFGAWCNTYYTIYLTVNSNNQSTVNDTACYSYSWNGITYNTSGAYMYTTTSSSGCDSIANLNLIINQIYNVNNNISICYEESISVGSNTYDQAGIYTDILTSVNGCDSIIITDLTISNPVGFITNNGTQILEVSANGGMQPYIYEVFDVNGLTISNSMNGGFPFYVYPLTSGQYYFVATDALGCVSSSVSTSISFPLGVLDINLNKGIFKITDMLGRKSKQKNNIPLYYIYDNGMIIKRVILY